MTEKLLEGLNDSQRKAVEHGEGPLLIVAGAGTGKTTVLTRRYAYLLQEKKLTTENILALTFTEKSAGEMEDRVLQQLPNGTYDFWISTFHGFCQRILEHYALEIGLPNHFKLLTDTDGWLMLKRRINELPLDHYRPLGNPVKFLAALLSHFSRAKDEGIAPEQYLEFAQNCALDGDAEFVTGERARLTELADCYFKYRQILREEGALDFGDLIVETLRLLRQCPHVLKELRQKFRYIMVDEFQDTNWAQYELIKLLAGNEQNLTVVGDDDQAIYKFRGASLANILQFRDDFPNAVTVTLTQNYRSHQEILDTAYEFIKKNNPNRLEVRLADTGLNKRLTSAKGDGGVIDIEWYQTLEDEAEAVAQKVLALKKEDPELSWNEIAILSRSNDGAEPFTFALERYGVPFRFYALRGLYGKPIVVDLVALLTVADNRMDSAAIWRSLNAPCYDFSARELSLFLHEANRRTLGLWQALKEARAIPDMPEETARKADRFISQMEALAETARREKPQKMLQLVLEKAGYLEAVMRYSEEDKIESINLLNAFVSRIKRYEQSTLSPHLRGFLEELRLEIDSGEEGGLAGDPEAGPELVKVMTIHASKGLEFRHVFIVSLVDQRFPTRPRSEAIPLPDGLVKERLPEGNGHLEEERRLFYVAMTRAKESLTLTGAEDYGGTRKKKPSVFLAETGIEFTTEAAKRNSELTRLQVPKEVVQRRVEEREAFPLKRRFSFTQLAAFEKCGMQYKYAHVYKIPVLGKHQKSFGQAMHLTFQDVLHRHMERSKARQVDLFSPAQPVEIAAGFKVPLAEALEIYEQRWKENDNWYEDRTQYERYRSEGREALKQLHQDWTERPPEVAALESSFEWRVGEHSLKGSVDRLDRLPNGHFAIIDYKTGRAKAEEDMDRASKEQLWIYQMAMEEKGFPIDRLTYVYVLHGTCVDVELLQGEDREEFRRDLLEKMNQVLTSEFVPSPSPFICRSCDFRAICEYKKL